MPVYNCEQYLAEAIESVLNQSFTDFEFIIIDDGSTDNTLDIIHRYTDKRILLLQNSHDFIATLNLGISNASGKYIARMDADDIMHIDRLKVQYSIMEEVPEITVCGTWVTTFGEHITKGATLVSFSGMIKNPLLQMLKGNILYHSTVIIRKEFLAIHNLRYENYAYAEDFKLWFEIAKCGGLFYVESFPLLYYRLSEGQVSCLKMTEQEATAWFIKQEIVYFLLERCEEDKGCIEEVYQRLLILENRNIISKNQIISFFYDCVRKVININ